MRRSVLAVALLAGLPVSAHAQDRDWAAAASGDWNTAANWSPADVPNTVGENAVISVAGTYTVTVNGSFTIGSLMLTNPNATVDVPSLRVLNLTANSVNNGLITVNPTNGASNALVQIGAPITLSGMGVMEFGGGISDSQLNTFNAGSVLTNGASHTLRGAASLSAVLVNEGLIRAEVINGETEIDLQSGLKTNNGLMQAGPGARLDVTAITLDQTGGGTIQADGGTVAFSSTNNLLGGTINKTGAGGLLQREVGTSTFTSVTIDDDFEIRPGGVVNVLGSGLVNNGTLDLNPENGSGNALIQFGVDGALNGTGEIVMGGGPSDSQINIFNAGSMITQASTHTIRGAGSLNATLVNNGLVRAEDTGMENEIDLAIGLKTNNNLMQAGPGARLDVTAITLDQTGGGTIEADGGTVAFTSTNSVLGGTIDRTGAGGLVQREPGTSTFTSVTIDDNFEIRSGGVINVLGSGLVNNGTIDLNPENGAGNAFIQFGVDGALNGTGEIVMGAGLGDAQINTFNAGSRITQAATHTIRGSGDINATLTNNGLIRSELVASGESELVLQLASKINNNLIQAGVDSTLRMAAITLDQSGGGVLETDGGTIEFTSTNTLIGGTLRETANGGLFQRVPGTSGFQGVTLDADLEMRAGGVINVTDGLVNNATLHINPEGGSANALFQFLNAGTLGGTGTTVLGAGPSDARINTSGAGTVLTFGEDQTLTGIGDLAGAFELAGTLEPGLDGVGPLAIAFGSFTMQETAVSRFELGGTDPADHDRFTTTSAAIVVNGELALEIVNGYVPQVGDEFVIMTTGFNGMSGDFDTVSVTGTNEQRIRVTVESNNVTVGFTCLTDINGDFILNNSDINAFVNGFLNMEPLGDINNDGNWNNTDINLFVNLFLGGCV